VAGVGAELTRAEQPNLPVTAREVGADAADCREAGASIYHLHVRDERGEPTMDVRTYAAALEAIKGSSDLIVQFSSGGSVHDVEVDRIAPLELKPEMASLTTGTVNFGDDVFHNPRSLVTRFYLRMRELGVLPEFEIFDSGMLAAADRLYEEHGDGHHLHYDFVLGVPGGMPAWPDAIDFLTGHLPQDATWSATGIGSANLSVTRVAVERGGHVRTGMEDVRWFEKDVPVSSNAQLVKRVADVAREAGRDVATPAQARELLGL
jgi:3-keto-5-aminohexanoate cleavage enzyme